MSKCRATDDGYLLNDEHYDNCEGDCPGCYPCVPMTDRGDPLDHCTATGRCTNHIPEGNLTCPTCLGKARTIVRRIAELYRLVPAVVTEGARIDSEAVNLAGPAMGAHEWSDWKAAEKIRAEQDALAKLDALRQAAEAEDDPEIRAGKLAEIPDQDEAVLAAWDAVPDDDTDHPYAVLGRWQLALEDDPRECYPVDRDPVSIHRAAAYLDRNLDQLAHDDEQDFPLFCREVRACLAHMEAVLALAKRTEKGAPCPTCAVQSEDKKAPRLVLDRDETDKSGARDMWRCPADRRHYWTEGEYRLRVTDDYRANAKRLTAPDILRQYRVPEGTTRAWAAKTATDGTALVRKRGRDQSGRQLYDVDDVCAVRDGTRKEQKRAVA